MEKASVPYVIYMNTAPTKVAIDPNCQSDPFYRYKMSQMQVQVIGNGKMVRTSLVNLEDVAKDLNLPPSYIPNYLAKIIGAQAKYDKKRPERERGSISGEYPLGELSDLVQRFIKEFVLCKKCKLPELTHSAVGNKKDVRITCRSCGYKGTLSADKDLNEKFRRFVINNPPTRTAEVGSTREKKAAADKAKPKPKPSEKSGEGAETSRTEDWSDLSEEARKERMEAMVPGRLKALVATEEKPLSPLEQAKPAVDKLREFASGGTKSAAEVDAEILRVQKEFTLDEEKRAMIVSEALFADSLYTGDLPAFVNLVNQYKPVLVKYVNSSDKAQQAFMTALALGASAQDPARKAALLKAGPSVFKILYDEDVLDEGIILLWHSSTSTSTSTSTQAATTATSSDTSMATAIKELKDAVGPFCKWLEEAEEEDDDDDDEDEDEEDEEGEAAPAAGKKDDKKTTATKPVVDKALEDEIDDL